MNENNKFKYVKKNTMSSINKEDSKSSGETVRTGTLAGQTSPKKSSKE